MMDGALRLRLLGLVASAQFELNQAVDRILHAPQEVVVECITIAEGNLAEVRLLLAGLDVDPL